MTDLSSALGSGDALKNKINSALKAEGLKESTGVTSTVSKPASESDAPLLSHAWALKAWTVLLTAQFL